MCHYDVFDNTLILLLLLQLFITAGNLHFIRNDKGPRCAKGYARGHHTSTSKRTSFGLLYISFYKLIPYDGVSNELFFGSFLFFLKFFVRQVYSGNAQEIYADRFLPNDTGRNEMNR